jgi:hypothetical protein
VRWTGCILGDRPRLSRYRSVVLISGSISALKHSDCSTNGTPGLDDL